MMKLKYSICCGLDVHKNVIVATIVITNADGISEYKQKSFSTFNSDIRKFHSWLIENNCYHVCMESTGKYWIPIFNYLENDIEVCLTHPKYVKAIKGKKTDKKDSKWIADLYKFDLVRCSFIPPKDFRQLREVARYRFKLELARSHLEYLDGMITQSEVELYVRIKPYYKFVELVSTMPGMTELSSTIVLAETGVDMSIFDDAKHLCSWCGLSPTNNESAGKKKSVRISKAGDYLKPMMVQCALAAIKSKKQTYFAIKYGRVKKRRGHKKAIIAIARMMIVCIYHMVSEEKPFNPIDYEELMSPKNQIERVILNENNVFAYLESLGYDSSKLVKRNDN